jgi:choline ABC transporter ATP-binding protein
MRPRRRAPGGFEQWIVSHKIPVGDAMAVAIDYVKTHGTFLFDGISIVDSRHGQRRDGAAARRCRRRLLIVAVAGSPGLCCAARSRSPPSSALALLFILNQGYWLATLETLSLVMVATSGVGRHRRAAGDRRRAPAAPVRRAAARARPDADAADLRVFDSDSGAVRPRRGPGPHFHGDFRPARPDPPHASRHLLGARPLIEAGEAFGATPMQLLWKVELPSAASTIIAGITQCIMLSLSMVVIAALVGAGGLGVPVVRALNSVQVGMGFEAGFTIVLLAIILDRISRPKERGARDDAAVEFKTSIFCSREQPAAMAARRMREALAALDAGGTRSRHPEQVRRHRGRGRANLSVARGEISVLMGLSGSGKSTLLRAANGLNPVTRGHVLVRDGDSSIDVATCDTLQMRRLRRERVAMVFQQFGLLPWRTVRENVGFGLELRGEARQRREKSSSMRKLELVGLSQWAERHVSELSGGMQQRVGLARAFATDADILLMDEPFSALDPLIRGKLQDELLALQERVKKTILFVSHDLDEALRLGDRISILQNGRIIQTGTAEDIVLAPADDYVAEFVRHMNPLDGADRQHDHVQRARCRATAAHVWLDERPPLPAVAESARRGARPAARRRTAACGSPTCCSDDGDSGPAARPGVAVAPASLSLQSIIRCASHRASGAARRGRQDLRRVRRGRDHPRARRQPATSTVRPGLSRVARCRP